MLFISTSCSLEQIFFIIIIIIIIEMKCYFKLSAFFYRKEL